MNWALCQYSGWLALLLHWTTPFTLRGFLIQEQVKLKQLNKALVDKIIKQWFRYTKAWKQHDVIKIMNAMIIGLHLPKQMKYYIFPGGIG